MFRKQTNITSAQGLNETRARGEHTEEIIRVYLARVVFQEPPVLHLIRPTLFICTTSVRVGLTLTSSAIAVTLCSFAHANALDWKSTKQQLVEQMRN